jgi:hypothetical protein
MFVCAEKNLSETYEVANTTGALPSVQWTIKRSENALESLFGA